MVADAPTTYRMGKCLKHMVDGSWKIGSNAGDQGLDVDRIVEAQSVNIKEGEMGGGDGPGKSDRVATVEVLKEKEKGIMAMEPQQEDIFN